MTLSGIGQTDNILNIDYSAHSPAAYDSESDRLYSYRQLGADVRRLADQLRSPRKRLVACFCRNDYQTLSGYLAALSAGHAVMLLDPDNARQSNLVHTYRPDFVLSSTRSTLTAFSGYHSICLEGPNIWRRDLKDPEAMVHPDLALLLTTSGSTGSAKLVRLSSRNILANATSIVRGLGIREQDCAITSLPFSYSYGLSVVHTHLLAGAKLVLTSQALTSRAFWDVCRRERCSSFAGVPYSYHVLRRLGLPDDQLPALTTLTQAGGHLSKDLVEAFFRVMTARKGRMFVMYGQTEATARIAILPPEWIPDKLGSAGRVIPQGEISISTLPSSSGGMIVYRGPNVMLGYAETREDLSLGDDRGGVLYTGDTGHFDRDGFLYVTGRLNRFAKVSGVRVNLDEVESLLKSYGPAAVIGSGERLVIFCESSYQDLFLQRRDTLARDLSLHRHFFDLRVLPSLPLKSNGKVDYGALEEAVGHC